MFEKMKEMMELQRKAKEMQKNLDALKVEKKTKDGKVVLALNGNLKVENVSIDESWLVPSEKDRLEKAMKQLFNEAAEEIRQKSASQAMDMMKGLDLKL